MRCVSADGERAPPTKLRLQGSLAHTSVCLGLYTRVDKKLVNGLPVWKDASGADRFIASVGSSWMCLPEASLGEGLGWLDLTDATCLSPDQSTKTWKESAGGGEWPEAPGLRCVSADGERAQVSRDAPPSCDRLCPAAPTPAASAAAPAQ